MDISAYLREVYEHPNETLEPEENNLCRTSVEKPRSHPLCEGNLGILRKDMPQFSGSIVPRSTADELKDLGVLQENKFGGVDVSFLFLRLLKNLGYAAGKPELVYAGSLKPTQSEIIGSKVWKLVQDLQKNPDWPREIIQQCYGQKVHSPTSHLTEPVPISEDDFILDMHHRLAAIIAASDPSGSAFACVRRIPLKMKDLLKIARKFAHGMGIKSESGV